MAEPGVASNGQKRTPLPQPGIILYPALGNPELVCGDDALHLLVCLIAEPGEMKDTAGKQVISEHLKFMSLYDTEQFKLRRPTAESIHPAFDPALVLSINSLDGFASSKTPTFRDENKRFYGIFRSTILRYFTEGTLHGYSDERLQAAPPKNVYHVEINGPGLRTWLRKNGADPELGTHCFANWMTKPAERIGADTDLTVAYRELEEQAVTAGLRKVVLDGKHKFVGQRVQAASDAQVDKLDPLLNGIGGPLRLFDIFSWGFNLYRPMATLHPVFFYAQDKCLNVGYISDLHVVSRLEIMRRSDFQLVPGAEAAHSPKISDVISTTGRAVRDLMRKAGTPKSGDPEDGEVDILAIGGDLIDFAMGSFSSPSGLAESLSADRVRGMVNADDGSVSRLYDYGVDYMAMYGLITDFYRQAKKPVVVLAGNHDAYDMPFGVSPRVGVKYITANPGIPADANLTVMEACLMYGDHYDKVFNKTNFNPKVMDCYYLLFTPVFSFTSKMGKMQWISLGWGDDEGLLLDGPGPLPGHLPNAENAVSTEELPLIKKGVDHAAKASVKCLMISHYTWACYSDEVIEDGSTPRHFPTGDRDDITYFNLGSCELNRTEVYRHFAAQGIHYAISGHAHRSGFYAMDLLQQATGNVYVRGFPIERFQEMREKMKYPYLIVSDSAGPIPRENVQGEFNGLGSNAPSFTKLSFNASGELMGLSRVQSTLPNCKPRLAVTMDYCEIDAGGDVFWLRPMSAKSGINPAAVDAKKRDRDPYISLKTIQTGLEHIPDWVGVQSMVLYLKEFGAVFTAFPILYVTGYGWAIKDDGQNLLKRKRSLDTTGLLSITLGIYPEKANGSTHSRYDFTKPWVVAIDASFSPASVGFFSDSDMELTLKRNWDYVKYSTQSSYQKLLPDGAAGIGGSEASESSAQKSTEPSKIFSIGKDKPDSNLPGTGMFQLPFSF